MKKNSKLRYVGLCAAALLLVAPVAAPAISAASNVSVVSAAEDDATVTDEQKAAYFDTYLNRFESKDLTSDELTAIANATEGSSFVADKTEFEKATDVEGNVLLNTLVKNDGLTFNGDISGLYYTLLADTTVRDSIQAVRDLITNKSGSVSVTLQGYKLNADNKTYTKLSSKTYQLNYKAEDVSVGKVVKSSAATFTAPLTAAVGDNTSTFKTFSNVLSDLKVVTDNGDSIKLASYMGNTTDDAPVVNGVSGDKFEKEGTYEQEYNLAVDATKLNIVGDAKTSILPKDFNLANSSVNGVKFRSISKTQYVAAGANFTVVATLSDGFSANADADGKAVGSIGFKVTRDITVGKAVEVPTEEKVSGVVSINYVPGYGIQVWDSYKDGKIVRDANGKAKKLAHGTAWKVFKKITIKGTTYYNLGGNQWVSDDYAKFSAK